MPYGPEDNPSGTDALPTRARMIFKAAANAIYSKYGADADARAHKVGWSAVKNAGFYKEKSGKWCKKDSVGDTARFQKEYLVQDWSPDQPRDPDGKWSGGGSSSGNLKVESIKPRRPFDAKARLKYKASLNRNQAMGKYLEERAAAKASGKSMAGVAAEYRRNEDQNYHSENIALLAKHYGTPDEQAKASEIIKEHNSKGYLPSKTASVPDVRGFQSEITGKYAGKLFAGDLPDAWSSAGGGDREGTTRLSRVSSAASALKSTMEGGPDLSTPKGRREAEKARQKRLSAMREGESGPRRDKARQEAETIAKAIGFKPSEADLAAGADIRRRLAAMREGESGPRKQRDALHDRFRSKITRRDRFGREEGTFEEEDDDDKFRDAFHAPVVYEAGVTVTDASGVAMMYDAVELDDAAQVGFTSEGYLKAMPRIARTGIQVYRGAECNRPDMDKVRIFRPADEVFKDNAWKTYTHLPVTLDHPSEPVTPNNWKQYAVGETGEEVMRDGTTARVPMMLRDAAAIQAYKDGNKQQLSVGYDCDIDWTPGVTDSGENYDAVQRNIRANHLAVVAAARGGPTLKIGDDNQTQENAMNLKTLFIDGLQCQMEDTAAVIVQRTIQGLQDQIENFKKKAKQAEDDEDEYQQDSQRKDSALKHVADAIKAKDDEIAKRDEAIKAKDAEVATLKAQVKDAQDPAKRNAEIVDRLGVISKAKAFLGDKWIAGDKPTGEIRREVVAARVGDKAKEWTDAQVESAFESLQTPTFSQNRDSSARSAIDDAVAAFGRPGGGYTTVQDERAKAYAEYDNYLRDAYKGQSKSN